MLVTNLPFNLSPKLLYTLVSLIVSYVLTRYAITLDPQLSEIVSLVIGAVTGYTAPAGDELVTNVGEASDDLLEEFTKKRTPE